MILAARSTQQPALRLSSFVPFRLNRLAVEVSNHLSAIYRERFGLDIPEWRVLVTVAGEHGCTAQQIVASTRMHKTRISRAISYLIEKGLIERVANSADRREMQLQLSRAGRRMYSELVPLALERERALMACMSKTEMRGFVAALDRMEEFLGLADAAVLKERE